MSDYSTLVQLIDTLSGSNTEEREPAMMVLEKHKDVFFPMLEAVLEQALEDEITVRQNHSAALLAHWGGAKVAGSLVKIWRDNRFQNKLMLAICLGMTEAEEVVPALLDLLSSDGWEYAHAALAKMGEAWLPAITRAYQSSENRQIRIGAVERLGFYPLYPPALEILLHATRSDDSALRRMAALGLSRFHYRRAVEALLKLVLDQDASVRGAVYDSLIMLDPRTALKALTCLMWHPDKTIVAQCAHRLVANPEVYFFGFRIMFRLNHEQFYDNDPNYLLRSLTSEADILKLLSDSRVVYEGRTVGAIATNALGK